MLLARCYCWQQAHSWSCPHFHTSSSSPPFSFPSFPLIFLSSLVYPPFSVPSCSPPPPFTCVCGCVLFMGPALRQSPYPTIHTATLSRSYQPHPTRKQNLPL